MVNDHDAPASVFGGAKEQEASELTVPDQDVERASVSGSSGILLGDPFQLSDGIVPDEQIAGLRRRKKGKHVAKYQLRQNNLISALLKPMEEHTEDAKVEEEAARLPVKVAIYASLVCNFALCVLQLYAAISSISLSLLATGIDAVFDISSNVLLFWLHRKAAKMDLNKWPVGGARLGTIGNIVYGFLMGSVNLVVIVESLRTLITKRGNSPTDFHLPSIIAVSSALVTLLEASQVRFKSFGRIIEMIFGSMLLESLCQLEAVNFVDLDPIGAIVIALGVTISWGRTVYTEFELLAGKSAPHDFLQLLIYKAATFSEDIDKIDTVRAYHSGPDYFVEVDVVMDGNTPLWKAHDVSQQLQDKIEVLPNVERAFVHVDHECTHTPEHRKSTRIQV